MLNYVIISKLLHLKKVNHFDTVGAAGQSLWVSGGWFEPEDASAFFSVKVV